MLSLLIECFALDRQAGVSNLLWRWLTAHIVHFSAMHWLLNLVGLIAIAAINRSFLLSRQGGLCFVLLCLWVSAGIWWLNPEISRYAGLSGVLHGLFVISIVKAPGFSSILKGFLLLLWGVKVLFEQLGIIDLSTTGELLAVAVAKDAHLYGLAGGILISACYFMLIIIDNR